MVGQNCDKIDDNKFNLISDETVLLLLFHKKKNLSSTASYIEKKEVYADMSSKVMSTRMLHIFLACMFKNIHSNFANNYQFFCYGNLIHELKN